MDSVFLLTTEFSHCHHMMFNMSQTENFILLLVPLPFFFDLVKFFYYFPYHSGFISVHPIFVSTSKKSSYIMCTANYYKKKHAKTCYCKNMNYPPSASSLIV